VRDQTGHHLRSLALPVRRQAADRHPDRQQLRDAPKKIADYLEFESEFTLRPPAEVSEMGLAT
jgi:hypothetical protein